MDELALLEQDEREATALLRDAQQKKRELLAAQAEAEAARREMEYQQYLDRLRPVAELQVMGVTHSKLRNLTGSHTMLGLVKVHPDILKLLKAAIVARTEQELVQLLSALATRLAYSHRDFMDTVRELRENEDTRHYFNDTLRSAPVVVAVKLPLTERQSVMFSELLTCYALEYGRITQYEEEV